MRLEYAFLKVARSPVFAASRTASRGAASGARVSCADVASATSSAGRTAPYIKSRTDSATTSSGCGGPRRPSRGAEGSEIVAVRGALGRAELAAQPELSRRVAHGA